LIKNSCIRTYKIADEKIYLQNIKALSKKKGGFKTIMAVYGYARVSREVQDLTRQLKALSKAGVKVENIFKDIGSGKDFQRIEYQKLVNKILKKGDILYITSVDRLGRDMKGIEEEYRLLTEVRECQIISLEEPFLSTSQDEITNDLLRPILLKFLGWVAERERKELLKRQKQAYNSMSKNSRGKSADVQPTGEESPNAGAGRIFVHVCGAVKKEGVYELSPDARVVDAIRAAGGCTKKAASFGINQAEALKDGVQVYVPTKAELKKQGLI